MKKKLSILSLISILIPLTLFSQSNVVGLQGLPVLKGFKYDKSIELYEWAGYNISIEKIKSSTKEKDISKLKKKFKIENIIKEYSSSQIHCPNLIIETERELEIEGQKFPEIKQHSIFYILENTEDSDLISISKLGDRDKVIEEQFLTLYFSNKLSEYVAPLEIDSINFIGRNIYLGNRCRWKSPNNINCMGGQMSWSVFDSYEKAKQDNEIIILKNKFPKKVIIEDTDIPVVFEGNAVTARRIVYQPANDLAYPLIVYYLVSEIEGYYVSTVLSHYGYNRNDYELPDLLKEVMQFEEMPESAWNKYSVPERDNLSSEQQKELDTQKEEYKFKHYFLNIKTGLYVPLGVRNDITGTSPYISLGLYINGFSYVDNETNGAVFADMGFTIPNNRKYFNYYDKELAMEAKADMLVNVSLGYVRKKKLKKNVHWENYGKLGIGILTTNQKKPKDHKKDKDEHYSVEVFSFSLGTNIRYKRGGLFLEYQFTPLNMSKHLNTGGNSAIIAGLNITL